MNTHLNRSTGAGITALPRTMAFTGVKRQMRQSTVQRTFNPQKTNTMKTIKWTEAENAALVAAYFNMLSLHAQGKAFSKAAVRRTLIAGPLAARSNGSIEFKLMNVSGVCASLGLPILPGYQPASNYQRDLVLAVQAQVAGQTVSIAA
jgi:hypothetical protein